MDQRHSRLIYCSKNNPLSCLEVRGLSFAPRSEGSHPDPKLIEIDGSGLVDSTVEVAEPGRHGLPDVLYVHSNSVLERNVITVPGDDSIWLDEFATADRNIIFVADGGNSPFHRGGHSTNRIIPSMPSVEAQDDSVAADVESLRSDFNALLDKLRSTGFMEA